MLRPDKKYSVYDLRQLKGKRCLTHVHVKSAEEAAAAEAAGIDLLSCSLDSPASQARLPLLVVAAPKSSVLLMSLGSGSGCDTQFLFYNERIPRHAKAY